MIKILTFIKINLIGYEIKLILKAFNKILYRYKMPLNLNDFPFFKIIDLFSN